MSLENEFEQLRLFARLHQRFDVTRCVDDLAATKDPALARMVLGVARTQMYVADVVAKAVEAMPHGSPLRDLIEGVTSEEAEMSLSPTTTKATCCLTNIPTECVSLTVNHRTFVFSRRWLDPVKRCYAFAHVLEKLVQHEQAREDPGAFAVWKDDEKQLRMLFQEETS